MFSILPWIASLLALGFASLLWKSIIEKESGNSLMKSISGHIQIGANAYLYKQYQTVSIFFTILFFILLIKAIWIDYSLFGDKSYFIPFAFLSGGFFSALAGFLGMKIAVQANSRTAWAAQSSLNSGLRLAFNSGTVMGMLVVGLGILHVSLWFFILGGNFSQDPKSMTLTTNILLTSAFGASLMALFARVGGGIFTKAADVGADLVGKLEQNIPEDDPRNPATIADNVGDNVGDVAGMGADLYESYIGSIVATMAIAASAFAMVEYQDSYFYLVITPLILSGFGIVASIIGTFFVRISDKSNQNLLWALRKGIYMASSLMILATFVYVCYLNTRFGLNLGLHGFGLFYTIVIGLLAGNIIGYATEYFTSSDYKPIKLLAKQSETGAATLIIAGFALGQKSTIIPVITVVLAIMGAFYATGGDQSFTQGLFGIGIASIGMLSTLGITLATDAYGPVADNAGGIAEMAHLPDEVRNRTDKLDSLGNTTAATGKGFAIGSAALTSLTLLSAYVETLGLLNVDIVDNLDIIQPNILAGLFLGAMLPFFFSALTTNAVGRSAAAMVEEVRRQFHEKPGILTGKDKPDYKACVAISTVAAQKEMIAPSFLAVLAPIIIGIIFGVETVVSLLAGALTCGFILAVMMANCGGAWDNAKKFIESGELGGKGSENHKAAVIGDTVGDPFKDTSGPSINILIKLMAMVSIIFASGILSIRGFFQ